MSRRAGIGYSESSEDEDYEYPRLNDEQRIYYQSKTAEQARKHRAHLERLRDARMLKAPATTSVVRPISTTALPEPARARRSFSSHMAACGDNWVFEANGRTHVLKENDIRLDRNYVGGHNGPGHSTASKLQRQGPRALSDVCNKDTISKDNTVGNQAQMDDLLASFGKRVLGIHCRELQKILDSGPELDLDSKLKPYSKVRY